MNEVVINKLINTCSNKDDDDHVKTQKFFKLLEESFESELFRCKHFLGCMIHPNFLGSKTNFQNPSIFITSVQTYNYVIKTCGYTFEDVPTTLLLGYYLGYIHYQYIFHQRDPGYPVLLIEMQRTMLEGTFPCITSNIVNHNTTRYTKTWFSRLLDKEDFHQIMQKFVDELGQKDYYLSKFENSAYLQKCINASFLQISTFIVVLFTISKSKWMGVMKKYISKFHDYNNSSILSLYYFGSRDAFEKLNDEQIKRIVSRIDASNNIFQIHEDYLENPEETLKKLVKPKSNKKKKRVEQVTDTTDVININIPDVDVIKEIKHFTFYYDESNDFVDLYNTLSYLEL